MKVALCLLTWNEIDGVKHDVPLIDRTKFEQIYCMDGGSTDGTAEYLKANGIPVYRQTEKGLNQACLEAVECCRCDAFVFYHPKGTIPVEDIYKFRAYFEDSYELVIGSRVIKGAHNEEDEKIIKHRKWFTLGLSFVAMLLFKREGNRIWDSLHGFRGMTVEAFKKLRISKFDTSIDIEMVCRSYKFKIKRIEFPTWETPRIAGQTHHKALPVGWKLIKYIFWELFRKE